jgi:hypothetical protein
MGRTIQRDPNRMETTDKMEETIVNQLKSTLMPKVLVTAIGVFPKSEIADRLCHVMLGYVRLGLANIG